MYFRKVPSENFNIGLLGSCLLKEIPPVNILNLYFNGYDHVRNLGDYLEIIENKRQSLINPYNHAFLCFEMHYTDNPDIRTLIEYTNQIADSFSSFYDDDIFIISLVYTDVYNRIHPMILLADMEPFQPDSTNNYLSMERIFTLIMEPLPQYNDCDLINSAIFLFISEDDDQDPCYDRVYHLNCILK